MKLTPGDLDKRVIIRRDVRTSDRLGGVTVEASDVATVWAYVASRPGRESIDGQRVNASAVYTFGIRFRENIFESDRLVFNGEEYNIRSISRRNGRDLYLQIEAERGVAQ